MVTTLAKSLRADRVSRLRLRAVCGVGPDATVEQAVRRMVECRSGCVLVMRDVQRQPGPGAEPPGQARQHGQSGQPAQSNGPVVGIFTERDFLHRVVAQGLDAGSVPVERVMTGSPKTVSAAATVHQAVELMESGGYRHLPVVGDDGQPVGVLSVKDIMRYLVEYFPAKVYNLPPTPDQTQPAREGA